jgi:hydroxymethylglutaryl-CoA lyase
VVESISVTIAGPGRTSPARSSTRSYPVRPAATGNIATEDLLYLLHRSGVRTGVTAEAVAPAAGLLASALGSPVPGLLTKAGPFPGPPPRGDQIRAR